MPKNNKHRYHRLGDGRIIDLADDGMLEYREGEWIKPEKPVSGNMLWFAEKLDSMDEVIEKSKLPYDPNVHFHGKPCCMFEGKAKMFISSLCNNLELVARYGDRYHRLLYPGDEGSRSLLRCKKCGAYFVHVDWEMHFCGDREDSYYDEWYQVDSEEQAERLLDVLPNGGMAGFDGPHFLSTVDGFEAAAYCADSYGNDPREAECRPDEMNDLLLLKNCLQRRPLEDFVPRLDEKESESIIRHLQSIVDAEAGRVFTHTATLTEVPEENGNQFNPGRHCVVVSFEKADDYRYIVFVDYNEEGKIWRTWCLSDERYKFRVDPRPKYSDEM